MTRNSFSRQQKIQLFKSFFMGLEHVYGTYNPATLQVKVMKAKVTNHVIYNHLKGIQPYGVFLLFGDRTRAAAVDFDSLDISLPLSFMNRARHYQLSCYIERSKSKGYHAWLFMESKGVLASKVRLVVDHILKEIECLNTEVFPKQARLTAEKPFGNFINAPLFGALVPKGKTVFVNANNGFQPYADQWSVLQGIQRIPEAQLDEIIEVNEIHDNIDSEFKPADTSSNGNQFISLLPCARAILEQGVNDYQRVTCFRLAIHFKRIGFPQDIAETILQEWSKKNRPINGKQIITHQEIIEQVHSAYSNTYSSYGCEEPAIRPFCDRNCPVYKKQVAKSG